MDNMSAIMHRLLTCKALVNQTLSECFLSQGSGCAIPVWDDDIQRLHPPDTRRNVRLSETKA